MKKNPKTLKKQKTNTKNSRRKRRGRGTDNITLQGRRRRRFLWLRKVKEEVEEIFFFFLFSPRTKRFEHQSECLSRISSNCYGNLHSDWSKNSSQSKRFIFSPPFSDSSFGVRFLFSIPAKNKKVNSQRKRTRKVIVF